MSGRTVYDKRFTQYDFISPHLINLGTGTPSDAMLKGCTQAFKTAADHRMVGACMSIFRGHFIIRRDYF